MEFEKMYFHFLNLFILFLRPAIRAQALDMIDKHSVTGPHPQSLLSFKRLPFSNRST